MSRSKIVKFLGFILCILPLESSSAEEWFCREASSTRVGQTITACGVGQSKNLEDARVKSRESSIEEFKRVCQLSVDCSDYDYTVIPKRTECETKDGIHICFRALDFEISDRKKKSISLDLTDLEREFAHKNEEIQNIQERIEKINQIKQSEQEAASKRKELSDLEAALNQKEAEALKLQDLNSKETIVSGGYKYLHQIYENSIKISFNYWDSKLTSPSENDIMWILAYEKRPFSFLGLQVYGGFGKGNLENQKNRDDDVPTQGTANSNQSFNGTVAYADMGGAVLIYSGWRGVFLKSDFGQLSGRKVTYNINYNGSGVGLPQKTNTNISSTYFGFHIGFDIRDDHK